MKIPLPLLVSSAAPSSGFLQPRRHTCQGPGAQHRQAEATKKAGHGAICSSAPLVASAFPAGPRTAAPRPGAEVPPEAAWVPARALSD